MLSNETLCIVVPIYNEEVGLSTFVDEWHPILSSLSVPVEMVFINDGSTDSSGARLEQLQSRYPYISTLQQKNSGHGRSCITGYHYALSKQHNWILQIDSDGQCAPEYFAEFWKHRHDRHIQIGVRVKRHDGKIRTLISRTLAMIVYLRSGIYIRDINSPYRLMKSSALAFALSQKRDCHLANALLTYRLQKSSHIFWIPISFRRRPFGRTKMKFLSSIVSVRELLNTIAREPT